MMVMTIMGWSGWDGTRSCWGGTFLWSSQGHGDQGDDDVDEVVRRFLLMVKT